jgi:hypothetical protein
MCGVEEPAKVFLTIGQSYVILVLGVTRQVKLT